MNPWDDFKNINMVGVVDAEGGGYAITAQSPRGWHFWLSSVARLTKNREALCSLALGLNNILENGGTLSPEGWEVSGAEVGTLAARDQEDMLIRVAENLGKGLGGASREGRA